MRGVPALTEGMDSMNFEGSETLPSGVVAGVKMGLELLLDAMVAIFVTS
jgi:hypothetical protein